MPTKKQQPRANQLILGLLFGVVFGFLLQKGGVAKYHVLLGVLLLEDFTVVKVMVSAIIIGMIGVLTLHRLGLVELEIKPTRIAANISGGLIFGVGFALLGYCPGTGSAALGQGNFDAIPGIIGLLTGSFLYAEFSGGLGKTIETWGDLGKLTIPDVVRIPTMAVVVILAPALALVLCAIELINNAK